MAFWFRGAASVVVFGHGAAEVCSLFRKRRTLDGMITLTSSLIAHQKAGLRRPALSLTGYDTHGAVPILRWTRWYSGAEAETPHAACVAADGSLIRVRNDAGTLRVQRVTSPTSGSTYSSWTSLGTAIVSATGVAVAADDTGRVMIVHVKTGGLRLSYRYSNDNGASWNAAVDVQGSNEGAAITWCAVTWVGNGWRCYYDVSATVRTRSESATPSSNWSSSTTITPASLASITGIACCYVNANAEVALLVSGTATTSGDRVLQAYNAGTGDATGNTWRELMRTDVSSGITVLRSPSLADGGGGTCVATFCETETDNVTYVRSYWMTGEVGAGGDGYFSEPAPLNVSTHSHGVAIANEVGETDWFLCNTHGVWNAEAETATLDYGDGIVALSAEIGANSARLRVTLAAAVGTGLAEDYPGLTPGQTLVLQAGYASGTADAAEYGSEWVFTTERVRSVRTRKGEAHIIVDAIGPWERLAATRAGRTVNQAGSSGSRARYFELAAARAGGLRVVADGTHAPSVDWTTDHQPAALVRAGESWYAVARGMLEAEAHAVVPDGYTLRVRSVSAADTSDLTISTSAGELAPLSYETEVRAAASNWARVQGSARYMDAHSYSDIEEQGPRLRFSDAGDATSNTIVTEYATAAVAAERWARPTGEVTIPWHAGLELLDVVTVTDSLLGVSGEVARVGAIKLTYDRQPGTYTATLTLTQP